MYLLGGLLLGSSFLDAGQVIVPFHVVVLDWIAYIVIAIALIPTLYMRLAFDHWRWIHLLLGAAMLLTGYSILIDSSTFDTSQIPVLRDYLYVIFGLGAAAFVWVAVVGRLIGPKREYRIVGAEYHPAANALELVAEPVGRPVRFEAGQFIYADLLDSPAQIEREFEAHPFSIASHPGRESVSLIIETGGRHTQRLKEISASHDARALLHGPFGRLVIHRPARHKQLWLAGGIGITPFLGMAAELAANSERYEGYEVTLILGVDHPDQAFKLGELEACARQFPGLQVCVWNREEKGLPTIEGVADLIDGELRERAVMLSGPEAMISNLTRQLLAAGVPRGQIRSERQIGPPGEWNVASPALRWMRIALTAFFGVFVVGIVVCTVGRAIFL
jgi:predicted ferric reductase